VHVDISGHREVGSGTLDGGPSIRAVPFDKQPDRVPRRLLDASQRRQLASIATIISLPPRSIVYREDAEGTWVFFASEGVLKAFRELPSGKRRVAAFVFPGDVFGIAESGRYMNTVQSLTKVTLYRIAMDALREVIHQDPHLQFQLLCKAIHELRQGQRHAILLGRRDAPGRLAMFLSMLERNLAADGPVDVIRLPMNRTDLAEYLGLSLESVSRAAAALERRGIVKFHGTHVAKVLDRAQFDKLVRTL
jgi:CRP/FNR family transcriptional regulator, anaerobic regulatory protein